MPLKRMVIYAWNHRFFFYDDDDDDMIEKIVNKFEKIRAKNVSQVEGGTKSYQKLLLFWMINSMDKNSIRNEIQL